MIIPLRPEEVPKDFVCAICLELPLVPFLVRKCHHVFCRDCIQQNPYHQECDYGLAESQCPVCRCKYHPGQELTMLEIGSPLSHRIWSSIPVKCEHHTKGCAWTGSLSDYASHSNSCPCARKQTTTEQNNTGVIHSLKEEIGDLKRINELYEEKVALLTTAKEELESRLRKVTREHQELKEVQRSVETPASNNRGGYSYNRHSVTNLAKLICQDLEDCPHSIDANKIFECVKNICRDLKTQYEDNPEHLYMDVRMLMAVCRASTWFSTNQLSRLHAISAEHGWP